MPRLTTEDLNHVLDHTRDLWNEVRGKRIFITGGTGFFGTWLLETFAYANDQLGLNASTLVLTRNLDAFKEKAPHLANYPAIAFHAGDIRTFDYPAGEFPFVIHGVSNSEMKGTKRILNFARGAGTKKILYISSGSVYAKYPVSADALAKRASELLFTQYTGISNIQAKIARCFAFVGPYLPLDANFAIGNFIRDGLAGGPICVSGDGTPYRSYFYAADMAIWLWTILFHGESCRPYNVGSEIGLTIKDLAHTVARAFQPPVEVRIAQRPTFDKPAERYVPSTQRTREELGLEQTIDLAEAIKRTIRWYSPGGKSP